MLNPLVVPIVRAVDLAPTAAFLMNIPGPLDASGKLIDALLAAPGRR